MPVRVLVVDDHEVVRLGLKSLLADSDIKIVAEASTGKEALKLATEGKVERRHAGRPDSRTDGLNVLGRIKLDHPAMPVLMLSTYDNPTYVARAVALGAAGYLLKDVDRDQLRGCPAAGGHGRERLDARGTAAGDRRLGDAAAGCRTSKCR